MIRPSGSCSEPVYRFVGRIIGTPEPDVNPVVPEKVSTFSFDLVDGGDPIFGRRAMLLAVVRRCTPAALPRSRRRSRPVTRRGASQRGSPSPRRSRRHAHAQRVDAALDLLWGHAGAGDVEEEDVGRHAVVDEFHARDACQLLSQELRVRVVLSQPVDVILEGVDAAGGDDPRRRIAPPNMCFSKRARSMNSPVPANTAPTGAPTRKPGATASTATSSSRTVPARSAVVLVKRA